LLRLAELPSFPIDGFGTRFSYETSQFWTRDASAAPGAKNTREDVTRETDRTKMTMLAASDGTDVKELTPDALDYDKGWRTSSCVQQWEVNGILMLVCTQMLRHGNNDLDKKQHLKRSFQ